MKVGFLHVGEDCTLPRIMVRSVQEFGHTIIQMTDEKTPAIDGCEVVRMPWDGVHLMPYRLKHLADLQEPDLCVLDTDTVMLKDVSDVWGDWDLALTKRGPTVDVGGKSITKWMPYNIGVMFVRDPAVWKVAHGLCLELPEEYHRWWGDQLAMRGVSERFRLLELPASEWNCTPDHPGHIPDARVLHYKGLRKAWMVDRWQSALSQN